MEARNNEFISGISGTMYRVLQLLVLYHVLVFFKVSHFFTHFLKIHIVKHFTTFIILINVNYLFPNNFYDLYYIQLFSFYIKCVSIKYI